LNIFTGKQQRIFQTESTFQDSKDICRVDIKEQLDIFRRTDVFQEFEFELRRALLFDEKRLASHPHPKTYLSTF
jgi:hypothetical protein